MQTIKYKHWKAFFSHSVDHLFILISVFEQQKFLITDL